MPRRDKEAVGLDGNAYWDSSQRRMVTAPLLDDQAAYTTPDFVKERAKRSVREKIRDAFGRSPRPASAGAGRSLSPGRNRGRHDDDDDLVAMAEQTQYAGQPNYSSSKNYSQSQSKSQSGVTKADRALADGHMTEMLLTPRQGGGVLTPRPGCCGCTTAECCCWLFCGIGVGAAIGVGAIVLTPGVSLASVTSVVAGGVKSFFSSVGKALGLHVTDTVHADTAATTAAAAVAS